MSLVLQTSSVLCAQGSVYQKQEKQLLEESGVFIRNDAMHVKPRKLSRI